jgi:hypothetical protein
MQITLFALHGLNRLLHNREPVNIAVSLAQIFVVTSLNLVTELDVLPLNQVSEDCEISGQLLQINVLL